MSVTEETLRRGRSLAVSQMARARRALFVGRGKALRAGHSRWPRTFLATFRSKGRLLRLSGMGSVEQVPLAQVVDGDVAGLSPWVWAALADDWGQGSRPLERWSHVGAHSSEEGRRTYDEFMALAAQIGRGHGGGRKPRSSGDVPIVRQVAGRQPLYQVMDGHHRLADIYNEGKRHATVRVVPGRGVVPVRSLLRAMSWMTSARRLYQPALSSPAVATWPVVRACDDRLDKIDKFLSDRQIEVSSYLDVGACYGFFVAEMRNRGCDAVGLELDPFARLAARALYDLDESAMIPGDALADLAEFTPRDLVSSFSLIHHFWMQDRQQAIDFLEKLWSVTGAVLVLDSGEATERWLRHRGAPSNTELEEALSQVTGRRPVLLGRDSDGGGANGENYGRELYAVVR